MTKALIGLVGDLLVNRDEPAEAFGEVREVLSRPDILFGNLEGAYTDDPRPMPMTAGGGEPPRTTSTPSPRPASPCCRSPTTTFWTSAVTATGAEVLSGALPIAAGGIERWVASHRADPA